MLVFRIPIRTLARPVNSDTHDDGDKMSRCAIKVERFTHFVALRHTVVLQIHHLKTGTSATCFP